MRITHLRNATMVVEAQGHRILVDPMLGRRATFPPFTLFRFRPKMNPLVDLPENSSSCLKDVDVCLITHSQALGLRILQHSDHLDPKGEKFLRDNAIPVVCPQKDAKYLRKLGLRVSLELEPWRRTPFLDGEISAIPAIHGYGWIHKLMANGAGFFIELPNEPSLYISGDTIFTDAVSNVLRELKPDLSVVAAGAAQLDIGGPLLMNLEDVRRFIQAAPGKVIANHLEALNHCPTTRSDLRKIIAAEGWEDKVFVPNDGEVLHFSRSLEQIY